jgi:hypothetical protein
MNYTKKIFFMMVLLSGLWLSFVQIARAESAHPNCKTECRTCASTCEKTLIYCRSHSGEHNDSEHIKALKDCISTCKQSADFMDRGSALQKSACSLCEKACLSCAESCSAIKGDKIMQACAVECSKCARVCHKMTE